MFIPPMYKCQSAADAKSYIQHNGFATLVATIQGKNIASHVPLYYVKKSDDQEFLYGHVSAVNELRHGLDGSTKLLAIFMEHHAYISSSWYDHVNVPTWNYTAVHVYGTARVLKEEELLHSIDELVRIYETPSEKPFHSSHMSHKELHAHLNGLIGFEMKIENVEAAWKLSQNRDDKNYFEIIRRLRERDDQLSHAIADEMERLR